jgi:predicted RNase H-like nuclease (RuvC/YqgF family)
MIVQTTDANFARDTENHAVINTNTTAYMLYKQQRDKSRTIDCLTAEVDSLKSDINEMKQLIERLIKNAPTNS